MQSSKGSDHHRRRTSSIRDVAKCAGVATSTVSRILSKRKIDISITKETRQRVLDACRKLRYQPNIHAQRIFSGRSNTIAVVVPSRENISPDKDLLVDINLFRTIGGILEAATKFGQHLLLFANDSQNKKWEDHRNLFRNRSIDGMLIWGAMASDYDYIKQISNEGWPLVLVNGWTTDESIPFVAVDNQQGAASIASHLLDLGHRQIAFLAGPESSSVGLIRRDSFIQVCKGKGVDVSVLSGHFSFQSGYSLTQQLLGMDSLPTAIAAASDLIALGALEAVRERKLRVPDNLSITGADYAFPYNKPLLTTFRAPMEQLGYCALDLLLQSMDNSDAWEAYRTSGQHKVPSQLIVGETSSPPTPAS